MSETPPKTRQGKNGGTLLSGSSPGRPKGSVSLTTELRKLLAADGGKDAKNLARALILHAAKGNGTAIKELWGRMEGPIKEELEHSGEVVIRVKRDRAELPDSA
jgi:hypothetical protein